VQSNPGIESKLAQQPSLDDALTHTCCKQRAGRASTLLTVPLAVAAATCSTLLLLLLPPPFVA
jgi:hypothetical protein